MSIKRRVTNKREKDNLWFKPLIFVQEVSHTDIFNKNRKRKLMMPNKRNTNNLLALFSKWVIVDVKWAECTTLFKSVAMRRNSFISPVGFSFHEKNSSFFITSYHRTGFFSFEATKTSGNVVRSF